MAATTVVRTPVTVRPEVRRGADLLDSRVPNWDKRIDLTVLDLNYCDKCIVGQLAYADVFGEWANYREALRLLGIDGDEALYGFDLIDGGDSDYAKLDEEWRDLITDRRA